MFHFPPWNLFSRLEIQEHSIKISALRPTHRQKTACKPLQIILTGIALWIFIIFTLQGIAISHLYTISWQKFIKDGLENARNVRFFWSANQSDQSFQSEFSGYTIFIFHFNREHVLFTQYEIDCNWFHLMPLEQIK